MAGPSPGASVFPQLPPKGAESPGDGPASPTGGGGGQRGPGRAGCQAWEDAEVGLEVSVRAQAQGGKNSCWSCIIKILLSGAWQSPINPHQGSTQNPLAAVAPCSLGTGSGLALCGESRGPGYGRPWAEPGWAKMGTGEGECGQGSGPGLPPGPGIPSTPPPVLGGLRVLPPPLQPLCPGPQHPSSCLPSSLPFSFRLPALLWAAPPPAPILPLLPSFLRCHPLVLPLLLSLSAVSGNVPFPSPAQVPSPSSMQPATTLDPSSIYPPCCSRPSHTHPSTRCCPSLYLYPEYVGVLPPPSD